MDDQEMIRDQMENTRSALTEKLETLEEKVTTTVQGATEEVAQTVEAVTDTVQETVETMRETVQDTLSAVKKGVSSVKSLFDVPRHVERHPWVAVGGSVAFGYLLGEFLLGRSGRARPPQMATQALQNSGSSAPSQTGVQNAQSQVAASGSAIEGVLERFKPELAKLKGLAVGALMGTFREMLVQRAGTDLGRSVSEILDSVTEKLGGVVVPPAPAAPASGDADIVYAESADDDEGESSEARAERKNGKTSVAKETGGRHNGPSRVGDAADITSGKRW